MATPFPSGYVSKLVRTARRLGLTDADVPDVYRRGREAGESGCPPFIGGALSEANRTRMPLSLDAIGEMTIAIVTVSHR